MAQSHTVTDGVQDGVPVRVLGAPQHGVEAAFAPGAGMVGCSLRHRGDELLAQRAGVAHYAATGATMGIPLLHPWANRLDGLRYEVAGRVVELDPDTMPVRLDPGGLPIHGLLAGSPYWEVTAADAGDDRALLRADLDYGAHPELLAGFPFPHRLEVEAELRGACLRIATRLRPTADVPVPVAFGWHPYLQLPGAPRSEWSARMPLRRHAELDERGIPTGASQPIQPPRGPLGEQTFDDLYTELEHPPVFELRAAARRVELRFESGYPVGQVYAPPGEECICFEPMTAATNALAASGARLELVEPGGLYQACFSIAVADA
jgi:galactose mutarotase-like enzyme